MNNQLKTVVLLATLTAILVAIGGVLGREWLAVMTIFALAVNAGAYFFSDRIVLRMHGAREASAVEAPQLHAMVTELAQRAGIPKPKVAIIPSAQPNAFATGRSPEKGVVAVTEGIVRLLTPRELRGVLAHELAHIANRDILVASIAATMATAISSVANALQWSAIFGGHDREEGEGSPGGALAMAFIAPVAGALAQFAISRSREFLADERGARISGDPEALASALEKLDRAASHFDPATETPATASLFIVNPFTGFGGMLQLFSTHPPTVERVRRLRALDPWNAGIAA